METRTNNLYNKKDIIRNIFLLTLVYLLSVNISFSQNKSLTKGDDFWYGFMHNFDNNAYPQYTYISSYSNNIINGTISIQGIGWTQNFSVNPNSTLKIPIAPYYTLPPFTEGMYKNAVHITTDDSVTVVAQNARTSSDDATIVYPTNALQDEYMVITWGNSGNKQNLGEEILIVATEDSTQINITPSTTTGAGHVAGTPYSITLDKGESYQITNSNPKSSTLTGTTIKAADSNICKHFAVFSGNSCSNIGGCESCDHLFSQVPPVKALGKEYILPPLSQKDTTFYRVMAVQNNTSVTINGSTPITLNKGQYNTFSNNIASSVAGDKPIMIMQYARGWACDSIGDPFQMTMYSIDQTVTSTVFNAFQSGDINDYYVNVIVKTTDIANTVLDGINVGPNFSAVPSNYNYSYAQIQISQGNHALSNPGGFLAYVYAWGPYESYGYYASGMIENSIPNITVCDGDSVPAADFTNTLGGAQSEWSNSNTSIGLADSGKGNTPAFVATNNTDTPITATITVTSPIFGCSTPPTPITYIITVNPILDVITGSNSPLCVGDTLKLKSKGGGTYSWMGPNSFNSSSSNPVIPNVSTNESGSYKVSVTDSNGCSDSAMVEVKIHSLPVATATPLNSSICDGDITNIELKSNILGTSYNWTTSSNGVHGAADDSGRTIKQALSGNGTVTYTITPEANGCIGKPITVQVTVNLLPNITAGSNSPICEGDTLEIYANGGDLYDWTGPNSYKSTNQNIIINSVIKNESGNYKVIVTDSNDCSDSETVEVIVKPAEACESIIIPNVITPNGDGKNDVFKIKNISPYPGTKMIVFDRWGRKVYESENYKNDWDGGDLSDGSYFYVITVNDTERTVYKGYVTILSNE